MECRRSWCAARARTGPGDSPGIRFNAGAGAGAGFFFQAEDGIRDLTVTGVQTCALPISTGPVTSQRSRIALFAVAVSVAAAHASAAMAGSAARRPRAAAEAPDSADRSAEIGRASCRERG